MNKRMIGLAAAILLAGNIPSAWALTQDADRTPYQEIQRTSCTSASAACVMKFGLVPSGQTRILQFASCTFTMASATVTSAIPVAVESQQTVAMVYLPNAITSAQPFGSDSLIGTTQSMAVMYLKAGDRFMVIVPALNGGPVSGSCTLVGYDVEGS